MSPPIATTVQGFGDRESARTLRKGSAAGRKARQLVKETPELGIASLWLVFYALAVLIVVLAN